MATAGSILLSLGVGEVSEAAIVRNGLTYAVASDGFNNNIGTHYHSNTGGAFGNPPGKAEVGDFFNEEVRGLSEYDLTGLSASSSALISFDVFKVAGLFLNQNDFPFVGDIDIVAYAGDNSEDLSDYQAATLGTIGTFNTGGLSVGDTLNFDVTSIFNGAIASSLSSLGVRLQTSAGTDARGGAVTFDDFTLTVDDSTVVPEPTSTLGLLALGTLGAISTVKRKQ
ncbi:MAG: PEP-CTERM sorting domain-containing protein [Cyanobacteriota bacterium]|nr:PEP-CTERM sorting domain-containing protein [Cyanobacteriota bacterium]